MPAPAITCVLFIGLYLAIGGELVAAVACGILATLVEFFLPAAIPGEPEGDRDGLIQSGA